MSDSTKITICLDCSWFVNREDYTRHELNARILDHALDTGHDIESTLVYQDRQLAQ